MAKVIECDACGKVDKPEETYVIDLCKRKAIDRLLGNSEIRLEVCNECYEKVLEVLNIDKQELN